MKSRLLIMVSGSVLALTACNKHDETTTNAMDTNVAMDNEAAANMAEPGPMTAQGFVNAVAASRPSIAGTGLTALIRPHLSDTALSMPSTRPSNAASTSSG